jgi:dephospho-CoA kinase
VRTFLLAGLTGGIATGKSTVSAMFAQLGCKVIDADLLAREAVAPGQPAFAAIVVEFGREVVQDDGYLDRKRLGSIVFADPERRKRLEAIVHPAVRARQEHRLNALEEEQFEGVVIWDVPLLFEVGAAAGMDRVIVVVADEAIQLERLRARDWTGEADARARIRSQMPVAEKARRAHYVIDNSRSRADTEAQVRQVHRALLNDLKAMKERRAP